ncbi:hypothetical protein DE146DRAFT_756345 [Phaeosphaeria sp. MPI-PUGE-AT-0046c]|nr:hypothetical protein DE146DRAFT_756345 [Phaeosphaeria sp. MPI-PUGE-AT-0046c]
MYFFSSPILPILLTAGLTSAVAETTLHNKCSYPVYYSANDANAPSPDSYIVQDEWFDGITGTALKVTKTRDGLWAGKPVLNFGYTVKNGEVWYDLSTVNGYDWWGEVVVLDGEKTGAETIVWKGEPGPNHVAHFKGELDLVLTTCA